MGNTVIVTVKGQAVLEEHIASGCVGNAKPLLLWAIVVNMFII
jgi:hypothetical protein